MSRSEVFVGNRRYVIVPDVRGRDRVFIRGTVTDDADGRAMAREVTAVGTEPLVFSARSASEIALAGNPNLAFTDPSSPTQVDVRLSADGYRETVQTVTIPAFPILPHETEFALRRLPVAILGRVFGRTPGPNPTFDPVPGALVTITPTPAPTGERPLLLRQPLRQSPGAGATLRARMLAPATPLDTIAATAQGIAFVPVDDGTGVVAGQVVRFGPAHRRTYAEIRQVIPHPDRPAPASLIELTEPFAGPIPSGAELERFTPGGFTGGAASPVGPAFAGESVIWLDVLPAVGDVIVVQEAGQPNRYHDVDALTGPAGDYLIDGLARHGAPEFAVSAAGFTTSTASYAVARLGASPLDWYLVP